MADDETHLFRTSWSLYDALSAENYMFHREIYTLVAAMLRQRHEGGGYSMLDLGCGNTRFLAPCLHAAPPARYDGVDLSQTALDEASGYLSGLENITLQCLDMLQALRDGDSTFDIIFSGYAVHHLDAREKQELFHACAKRLSPGGAFILVDIAREEGQTRQEYLDTYLHTMRSRWTAVSPADMDAACAHVAAYDFPETVSDLTRMAQSASFREARLVDRFAQHHVLAFSR
ncbi:MAG: class I SAM-dependent methyltransferase [Verrucomicrobiaceae bacterium]|nr:class I SAM-dependent methyltransferase [Verrucomicrobiaceae bacterium]